MSKNPKIEGIVFRYGDDDYSFWMPDISKDENEKFVQTLFAAFEDNGCSVRGTKRTSSIPSEKTPETIGANLRKILCARHERSSVISVL